MKHTRFVAYGAAYSHGAQEEIAEPFATGKRILQKHLEAQFNPRGITEYEIEQGAAALQIHGLPEDRIEGGEVSPRDRLSVWDSALAQKELKWNDDETQIVIDALRDSDRYGMDFVEIVQPLRPAPWKGYDRLVDAEKIAAITVATETSPSEVIAYELENQERADVLDALAELVDEDVDESINIDAS